MLITTDNQQRVIDTFFLIAKETPDVNKISLQMIASRLGIRRESIYKYCFRTPDEILERAHYLIDKKIEEKVTEVVSGKHNDFAIFLSHEILPLLYEKKDWLQILYNTCLDPKWGKFLEKKYAPLIERYLDNIGKEYIIPNNFLALLVVKEFFAIVSTWLKDPNPEPTSLFQKKFLQVFNSSPNELLSQSHKLL